jgi:hypothetical protein
MLLSMRVQRLFPTLFLGGALLLGLAPGWSQPRADESGAKQDARAAGKDTKKVAVKTGNGVKKGTGKALSATKNGTRKVFHKTKTTTKGAVDGGKDGAKQ